MKALLIIENLELRGLLSFYLRGRFGFEVLEGRSHAEGITLLKGDGVAVDYVFCDFSRGGRELMSHVFKNSTPVPFIAGASNPPDLSASKVLKKWVHFIRDANWIDEIDAVVERIFKESGQTVPRPAAEYLPIRVSMLLLASPLPCAIHHSLTPGQFAPVMQAGAVFDAKHLKVFQIKNKVEHLFVARNDIMTFCRAFEKNISSPAVSMGEEAKAGAAPQLDLGATMEAVQELAAKVGFSPEVREFTKANVLKTINEIKKLPRLNAILSRLNRNRDKYISNHSMLLAHLSCALAAEMEWKSETTYHKLTLASFLHDITLANEDLARLNSMKELGARLLADPKAFTAEEIAAFKQHPAKSAEVAKQFDEVPPDVDVILLQHHERPDGSGFPRGLTHTWISPLTAVFIVAHDLVQFILEMPKEAPFDEVAIQAFLSKHKEEYVFSNFKKTIEGIRRIQF